MLPASKDKPLFTPGPLTTSQTVKQAMLRDLGSRDKEFIRAVQEIRRELLEVAGVSRADGIRCRNRSGAAAHPTISAVAVVHCETTTGIMNPIREIGEVVRKHKRIYFVDSMSAFGAVEFDFRACEIDYLVSSANKCIKGVPGFSFCIARRSALESTADWSPTLSLDLHAQWLGLNKNGQFRFTPPTHTMLVFRQALEELKMEGGVAGRQARYQTNCRTLLTGMQRIGFAEYLPREKQGHIITSFLYPDDKTFCFETFYEKKLNERGLVIYPGKVSGADCFRIGKIGRIFDHDVTALQSAIETVVKEMGVRLTSEAIV